MVITICILRMKFVDLKDTSWNGVEEFYFNKLKKDSVYSIAFNSEQFSTWPLYS